MISQADEEVIGHCVQQREGTEDTDSGSPAVDVAQVKDHLMKVFGHLLQKDELMKSKCCSVFLSYSCRLEMMKVSLP